MDDNLAFSRPSQRHSPDTKALVHRVPTNAYPESESCSIVVPPRSTSSHHARTNRDRLTAERFVEKHKIGRYNYSIKFPLMRVFTEIPDQPGAFDAPPMDSD